MTLNGRSANSAMSSPTSRPTQAPPANPDSIARPQDSRPTTFSTMRRPLPTMATASTGNFWSERKSTARWAPA